MRKVSGRFDPKGRKAKTMRFLYAGLTLLSCVANANAATALSSSEQRGRAFAEANCARCHATDATDASPLAEAPPLRRLHEMYPVEDLEESLAEGIRTGHSEMPEFHLEPGQIADFIAYLKTLE